MMSMRMARVRLRHDPERDDDVDRPAIIAKGIFGGGMAAILLAQVLSNALHLGTLEQGADFAIAAVGAVLGALLAWKR